MAQVPELPSRAITPVPIDEHETLATPPEQPLNKGKSRQRLLRGIQRMSSTSSLTNLRRPRAHSSPYRSTTRSSLSCVSLVGVGPSQSFRSTTPQPSPLGVGDSPSSRPGTPLTEFPFLDAVETQLGVRKVENGKPGSSHGTAPLPAEIKSSRTDVVNKSRLASAPAIRKRPARQWHDMPHEIQIHILSFLEPRQLVQASRVSKSFYRLCFDGQLWTSLDASEFYQRVPAESLSRIIMAAGPFIKDLNLRGCMQVEHYKRAEVIVKACKNLMNATFEGCRNFQKSTLHSLLESNGKLVYLNLTGLSAVTNKACQIIANSCPQLETFNVSWCSKLDAAGIKAVIEGCGQLTDLRAGEVRGFDDIDVAEAIFRTNNLERLVLSGCAELTDQALEVMVHGTNPEIDILTDVPVVPPRKLRHLDLSRCPLLTDVGVKALGHLTPELEGLQLSRCRAITDAALEPILASTPRLSLLELEDLDQLTNTLLSEHLAKAPCAATLAHLSLSYCENIGDVGMLPVMQKCVSLQNVELDNTRVSNLVLAEAAAMVHKRSRRTTDPRVKPKATLRMVVYDCQHVSWTGVREVLFRNARVGSVSGQATYPTEVIALKCFYGHQMTADEHLKRVLRGDYASACRLERMWADYMQAMEEAGVGGSGHRRRRRRARHAAALHLHEEDGGGNNGRRRAATIGSCSVM
ncbi:F-box/LRR-repeat protein-like protein [Hapsidospora chrysogenum ATCC 11550]|uniref:F-box/LRR-repeat protein-like protein n=1 Tax=Hapsidospora chrysogenum (strain ATCC 11550 / CBS 779.69 / DSM 880 / IAM 14645 / JCM 23072 / IMI 49137) TaxID=857340 RepID=A0A086TFJ3_HAPC1|nr:F-box/LRR-repeat protein-like protein [Hapsidospora chrysogenum ATCC 11550]